MEGALMSVELGHNLPGTAEETSLAHRHGISMGT